MLGGGGGVVVAVFSLWVKKKKNDFVIRCLLLFCGFFVLFVLFARLVIERTRVPVPAGVAGESSSPGSTFCADPLLWYPFHPSVAALSST